MLNRSPVPASIGFVFLLLPFQVAHGQITQSDLRAYTEKALANGSIEFEPPKFDWGDHGVKYQLGQYSLDREMDKTLLASPLHEQFVVTGIRRYRTEPQQQKFWGPVLEQVEGEIQKMLDIVQKKEQESAVKEKEFAAIQQQIHSIYLNALDKLAQERGGRAKETGVPCALHVAKISTNPKTSRLERMGAGERSFYLYFKDKAPVQEPQWESLPTGEGIFIYGKNWIRAEWPDGKKWEKLIDLGIATSITITPEGVELKE